MYICRKGQNFSINFGIFSRISERRLIINILKQKLQHFHSNLYLPARGGPKTTLGRTKQRSSVMSDFISSIFPTASNSVEDKFPTSGFALRVFLRFLSSLRFSRSRHGHGPTVIVGLHGPWPDGLGNCLEALAQSARRALP